ncbi:MAG: 4Fe-4S dicluster domain-containing protein [Treponemataceae bacterium]
MSEAIEKEILNRSKALLADGTVTCVAGWKKGLFEYDVTPAIFESPESLDKGFVYNKFCGSNLSKYMIEKSRAGGKVLALLKPCDTYSFNQLLKEYRILRENVYIIAIPCFDFLTVPDGKTAAEAITTERCGVCKSKKHVIYDELIGEEGEVQDQGRFNEVAKLEAMTPEQRYEFWRGELSRCIRCNACRNVCPACSCEKCVFDNPESGISQKAAADSFEENMFHVIRAFHVAGRCTDCGECSRVCPQNIPLHLLNRKFIKDIDELYGEYQAGADLESKSPLNRFDEGDVEPSIVHEKAENAEQGGK